MSDQYKSQENEKTQTFGSGQQIIINQVEPKSSNGLGIAGFVLALLGLLLSWAPVVNLVLWILGLVFSIIALFKKPRGFAIAGLVLSLISILIVIAFIGAIGAFATLA